MVLYWYQIPRPALDAAQGMNYRHMWAKVVKHTHTHFRKELERSFSYCNDDLS